MTVSVKEDVHTPHVQKGCAHGPCVQKHVHWPHGPSVQGVDAEVTHKPSVTISAKEDGVNP